MKYYMEVIWEVNNKNRTYNSLKNISIGVIGQAIQLIMAFIGRTFFIKYLSTDYLGLNGLFLNLLSFLSLAELGVGNSILYALYKPIKECNELKISALMNYFSKVYKYIGVIIFILGICIIPFFPYIITDTLAIKENIVFIYLLFLFNTSFSYFFSYKQTLLNADQNYYIINIVNFTCNILQLVLQVVFLYFTKNFIIYLAINIAYTFSVNIAISIIVNKKYPFLHKNKDLKLDKYERNHIIKNVKYIMISKISGVLVNNTDNIIISSLSGLTNVGLISNYTMITNAFNQLLNQVFNSITASVGNLNVDSKDRKHSYEVFKILNLMNFWLYGFTGIAFCLMANELITIWIGERYCLSFLTIITLSINYFIVGMQNTIWVYKNTMGLFKYGRYILFITAFLNIVLSLFLGNKFGLFGVFLATIIARLVTNVWYDPYVIYKRGLKKNPLLYLARYVTFFIIIIVITCVTKILLEFITVANIYLNFGIHLFIVLLIPNLLFIVMLYKYPEFKYVKKLGFSLIKKAKQFFS